ncbi:DUF2177 family protein [Tepidamorphus sp. 3E244]|uniref:DUF2177 family protein n=1 Tax=Tepidamorphus sp. 3E244 TaxID=3385498 RepID=UPI0038FC127C
MQYVIAYIATAVVFLGLDYVWLAHIARQIFVERIGHLLLDQPKMVAAAGFYLVYVVGIVFFAISPALKANAPGTATLYGALFGFFCYATYEMTNHATLKDWPVSMVAIDVAWGTFLTGLAATAGYFAAQIFAR